MILILTVRHVGARSHKRWWGLTRDAQACAAVFAAGFALAQFPKQAQQGVPECRPTYRRLVKEQLRDLLVQVRHGRHVLMMR